MSDILLKFTIPLTPITKKNSSQIVVCGGKPKIIPSKKFKEYQEACGWFIKAPCKPIDCKCNIEAIYYMPTRHRVDITNLYNALSILRCYDEMDENTGKTLYIYEVWNDKECVAFKREANTEFEKITYYNKFEICNTLTGNKEITNTYKHNFDRVPFIPFSNNNINTSDLENIKGLIDTYDKVYSGFVNDLEDIQEIIFILTGYEGENLGEFLGNLKKYKTVKLDSDIDVKGDLKTLTIDIPVEAREKLLTMTRKAIFEQGQGVDPEPGNFGNASGVALQYLYSLLELKAGLLETEFKLGLSELVRAICDYKGIACNSIVQTWTRTSIRNDLELSEIARNSKGLISDSTLIKNHPWVEDPEKEIKEIEKQEQDLLGQYSQPKIKGAETDDGNE